MKTENTVTLNPTWAFAVAVYTQVLQNPKASREAIDGAIEDLQRLARIVDSQSKGAAS